MGFETNIEKNSHRKNDSYKNKISELSSMYNIKFINLSMGAIGIIGKSAKDMNYYYCQA